MCHTKRRQRLRSETTSEPLCTHLESHDHAKPADRLAFCDLARWVAQVRRADAAHNRRVSVLVVRVGIDVRIQANAGGVVAALARCRRRARFLRPRTLALLFLREDRKGRA